jgi:hypothetical protein
MLAAKLHLLEGHWEQALSATQHAEAASHVTGAEHAEVLRLRSACFHHLGRQDLSKECLFQSATV